MSDDLLLIYRLEHSLHCTLYICYSIVDDLVISNALCDIVRLDIEPDDDGIGCCSQVYIRLGDRTDSAVDDLYHHLVIRQLLERRPDSLDRALYIGLYDDIKLLDITRLDLAEQIIKAYASPRLLDQILLADRYECRSIVSCFLLRIESVQDLTCIRNL